MSRTAEDLKPYMWKKGQSGNPAGAKKGVLGGRANALKTLDSMMAEAPNVEKLRGAFQEAFDKNPLRFFKDIVMPLLPKESISRLEGGDRVVEWRSLLTVPGEDVAVSKPFPDETGAP